jgi:hypothetical protein
MSAATAGGVRLVLRFDRHSVRLAKPPIHCARAGQMKTYSRCPRTDPSRERAKKLFHAVSPAALPLRRDSR